MRTCLDQEGKGNVTQEALKITQPELTVSLVSVA